MSVKHVMFCAIANISSGACAEDCSFCAQSARYKAKIDRYRKKPLETIVQEAHRAREAGATGFCLVTAGRGLDDDKVEFVASAAQAVKKAQPDLHIIACNGTASLEHLKELKKSGVDSYNHNLETAREFYPSICTTHTWDERFETCLRVKEAQLFLCSGGIFGLGESIENRKSLLKSLQELAPHSTPVNFFHPNVALPLESQGVGRDEALEIIRMVREYLPHQRLMVAGGRERVFGENFTPIFEAGAQAMVIGDYLTTTGANPKRDRKIVEDAGYEIILKCES